LFACGVQKNLKPLSLSIQGIKNQLKTNKKRENYDPLNLKGQKDKKENLKTFES
jgi:hypothetical protein